MKQTQSLRMNYEFSRVYQKGRFISGRFVVLHYLKRNGGQNRLGITASRKLSGSVRRNRMKRLLRESYRLMEDQIRPGFDLVFVGRNSAVPPDLKAVFPEMAQLLHRAGLCRSTSPARPDQASGGTKR